MCTSNIICTVNTAWLVEGTQPRLLGICIWSSDLAYVEKNGLANKKTCFSTLIADYIGLPLIHLLRHSRVIGCTGCVVVWLTYHNSGAGQSPTQAHQHKHIYSFSSTESSQPTVKIWKEEMQHATQKRGGATAMVEEANLRKGVSAQSIKPAM